MIKPPPGFAGMTVEELITLSQMYLPVVAAPIYVQLMEDQSAIPLKDLNTTMRYCAGAALTSAEILMDEWCKRISKPAP